MNTRYILFFLAAVCISHGGAMEYYVSPDGNDTGNSGTAASDPYKTISKAAGLAKAGDIINISAGTYQESVTPAASGTAEKPIIFRKSGSGNAVVTAGGSKYCFIFRGKNHLVLDGVTCSDSYGWVNIEDAGHITVQNCTFNRGSSYHVFRIHNGSYNKVLDCTFLEAKAPGAGNADYIGIWRNSHYNLIQGCEFNRITHNAVTVMAFEGKVPSHTIIRQCTFLTPGHRGIACVGSDLTLIEQCTFTGEGSEYIRLAGTRTLIRHTVMYKQTAENNQVDPNWDGMVQTRSYINERGDTAQCQYNRIVHNVFYAPWIVYAITMRPAELVMRDNIFRNNIFYKIPNLVYHMTPLKTENNDFCFEHNLVMGSTAGYKLIRKGGDLYSLAGAAASLPAFFKDNLEQDPGFLDENSDDFHLTKGSPCVDAGAHLTYSQGGGSGNQIKVRDVLAFCDGFGLISGDLISIGSQVPVTITAIDYTNRVLTVDKTVTWQDNDPVSYLYKGSGPDMGAYEYSDSGLGLKEYNHKGLKPFKGAREKQQPAKLYTLGGRSVQDNKANYTGVYFMARRQGLPLVKTIMVK